VTRQLVSFSEPKLFFIDPVLIAMALLYRRGWFDTGSSRSVRTFFNKKTLRIPLNDDKKNMPMFVIRSRRHIQEDGTSVGVNYDQPASIEVMGQRLKTAARQAGFLFDHITLYAFRYGFADHLLQKFALPDSVVKKLMNHSPNSNHLRNCYEGDLKTDVLSIRESQPQKPEIEMNIVGQAYVWRTDKPRELTKEEQAEIKAHVLETDEKARALHEKLQHLAKLRKSARRKNDQERLQEYVKRCNKTLTAFQSRLRILQNKKLKELRQAELDEMMATMTLEQLKEKAFNPPEGRHFESRIECLAYLIGLQDRENNSSAPRVTGKRARDGPSAGVRGRKRLRT
jgi:hypothetical protein